MKKSTKLVLIIIAIVLCITLPPSALWLYSYIYTGHSSISWEQAATSALASLIVVAIGLAYVSTAELSL